MNQILVTKKLYITPELRRKKSQYKIQFFLSVVLVCLLFSYYIYAEYDRTKSEEVSQEILQGIQLSSGEVVKTTNITDTTVKEYDGMIVVQLDDDEEDDEQIINTSSGTSETGEAQQSFSTEYTYNNVTYSVEAILNIPSLGINYPVISEWSEELLKVSLNKYWGPKPNEVGNYCIIGHNYKSGKMFGNLPGIADGAIIELTDSKGRTLKYSVYDRYVIDPTDTQCTSQLTGGKKELTLITCREYGSKRMVVKAKEIKG